LTGEIPVETPRRRKAAAPLGDTVLVTGASGFIGTHLVPALLDSGRTVRAMVRSDEGAARVAALGPVEIVRGDVTDAASLKGVADGCGLVYHLAGDYRGSAAAMHTVHAAGTAKLLRVVDPRARVVFVSSSSVYGWDRDWPADHATRPKPETAYGTAKLAAERLVLARPEGPSVVARTTIVYGAGDDGGMLARAHSLMTRGMRRFPGTGRNRIHLLHVDDLVAGLLLLAEEGAGVFLFAGPSAAPIRHIFGLLAEGAAPPAPSFGVPTAALRPVARTFESAWAAANRDGEPPLNRHSLDVITRDRAYSWARASEELGWSPRVELEEGVPQLGKWLSQRTSPEGTSKQPSAASIASGNAVNREEMGYDWRGYMEDPDEGLGTVYERFALHDVLMDAVTKLGARNVLHAPLIGMMGIPGIDALMLARAGIEVGLLDFVPERLESIVRLWHDLGVEVTPHLVPAADPAEWPAELPVSYDLVFSFAALWWFEDPWAVLRVQARWATKGVLVAVPNKNVFMRARARLWHRDLFTQLNEEALDRHKVVEAAREIGLKPIDTGLFDIPPFPDTSVPLARVVKAVLDRKPGAKKQGVKEEEGDGPWAWSILPYLKGEQPDIEDRMRKLARWERFVPDSVAPGLAHHRYTLLEKTPLPMS
jgi:UDP-glucose 4-epimerase